MPEIRFRRPLRLFAPAKVNLGLEVLRCRDDGYHDILTIMQTISLFDEIFLTPSDRFDFRGDARIEQDGDLAYRAVQMFQQQTGVDVRANIRIVKRIPVAGGLGGGSSDAGTLLRALCDLASIPAAVAHTIASALGSDVPFFLRGGTSLSSDTGTVVEPLPDLKRVWLSLATPKSQTVSKTASHYAALTPDDFSDGATVSQAADAIRAGEQVSWETLPNAFTRTVMSDATAAAAGNALLDAGASFVLLSGAGPTLFTVSDTWQSTRTIVSRLRAHGLTAVACTLIGPDLNADRIARSRT